MKPDTMCSCSVCHELQITEGTAEDYHALARRHYRDDGGLTPYVAIYTLRSTSPAAGPVGVIVYTMPPPNCKSRNIATDNFFTGVDRKSSLALLNKYVRRISRIIIEPRYRGLGLAGTLVARTMLMLDAPIIEALAVMGQVNPFFEKAGMTAYETETPLRNIKLTEALSLVGIEKDMFIDAECVRQRLDRLDRERKCFIEQQFLAFLQPFGKRRYEQFDIEQIRFILSKLTTRPLYYIWFNPDK